MTWNRTRLGGWALNIIIALGLPVILTCHGRRAARLTLAGYAGLFATLVMLNISESCYEAFIKPYLATHGGVPGNPPGGFAVFEDIALVFLLAGLICLGIAVIRARVFPRWTGALFIASPFLSVLGLPGPLAELSDYLAFIALATIGLHAVRTQTEHPERLPHETPGQPAQITQFGRNRRRPGRATAERQIGGSRASMRASPRRQGCGQGCCHAPAVADTALVSAAWERPERHGGQTVLAVSGASGAHSE